VSVTNSDGRKVLPTVRGSGSRLGSGGASCRRLVVRWRRSGRAGSTLPRTPALSISSSSSASSSSQPVVSSPRASPASRMAWASARFSIHRFCSSVGSSGSMTGSWSRCQPSRHWAELDRANTGAVFDRQVLNHVTGQRHRQPLGPCPRVRARTCAARPHQGHRARAPPGVIRLGRITGGRWGCPQPPGGGRPRWLQPPL
jgi:hypothetical protein